tara:strand:- start:1148 stop:1960 length:813 start_codon:yes stop_codon:yes gene_type:complete
MNFSAHTYPENTSVEQIESLRDWWSLAGVDLHYNSEPTSLLAKIAPVVKPVKPEPIESNILTESKQQSVTAQSVEEKPRPQKLDENFPVQHDEYLAWLSKPENLVEAQWSQKHVLPTGTAEPEIMIIVGMPEQSGLAQNSLFSEKSAALLTNMLNAIGCDSQKTYLASLSLGRPYDGHIDPQYHDILKKRMLHQIGLVQPKRIIIFGETPSHLFFEQNLLTARKNKQFINHISAKTEAIATFHPRILIERPEFKAEAWKDLQLLTRIPSL